MPKQTPKRKKRGPKEERLGITDAAVALAKTAAPKIATLRNDFKKAHADGMAALQKQDFDALGDAIKRERDIIKTQSELIDQSIGKKSTRRK